MPWGILHPMVWGISVNLLALILETINLFLPCKLIFWKSYQSWELSKFSEAHILSCGEFLNHKTLSHYYKTHIEYIFENITYIIKKTPKLVAKIWLPNLVLYQTVYLWNCSEEMSMYTLYIITRHWLWYCTDTWRFTPIKTLGSTSNDQ